MQLVVRNWANFQLHVSYATENQLHKTVAKCQISSSGNGCLACFPNWHASQTSDITSSAPNLEDLQQVFVSP